MLIALDSSITRDRSSLEAKGESSFRPGELAHILGHGSAYYRLEKQDCYSRVDPDRIPLIRVSERREVAQLLVTIE